MIPCDLEPAEAVLGDRRMRARHAAEQIEPGALGRTMHAMLTSRAPCAPPAHAARAHLAPAGPGSPTMAPHDLWASRANSARAFSIAAE